MKTADSCIPSTEKRIHGPPENLLCCKLQGVAAELSPLKERFVIYDDDRRLA
jgi:hypothetical protein